MIVDILIFMLLPYIRIAICYHHNFRSQLLQAWSIKTISIADRFCIDYSNYSTRILWLQLKPICSQSRDGRKTTPLANGQMAQESKPSNPPIKTTSFSHSATAFESKHVYIDMFGVEGGTTLLKKQTCSYTSNSSFQTGKKGFGRSSTPPKNPKEDDRGVSTPHFFGNLRDPDASSAMHGWGDPPKVTMTSSRTDLGDRVFSKHQLLLGSMR